MNNAAFSLAACQIPTATAFTEPSCDPETIRSAKGRFPDDLNRLRGQLSLEASVGEPVVCALDCGDHNPHLLIAACDDKDFYGIWSDKKGWTPVKEDQLYGSAFSSLIQQHINGGSADIWVASFLAFPTAIADVPVVAAPVGPAGPTKKKVVRKRALATPVVVSLEEEPTPKKPATAATAATEAEEEQVDL